MALSSNPLSTYRGRSPLPEAKIGVSMVGVVLLSTGPRDMVSLCQAATT